MRDGPDGLIQWLSVGVLKGRKYRAHSGLFVQADVARHRKFVGVATEIDLALIEVFEPIGGVLICGPDAIKDFPEAGGVLLCFVRLYAVDGA